MDVMRLSLAALALVLSLAVLAAPEFGSREELRGEVRKILLDRPCKECHLGTLITAKPKALKVFDLQREDWPSTMQDRQFAALRGRLSSGMSPTAGPREAEAFDAGTSVLDTVDRFIQAELAAREAARARKK
jgi:hypothetical protein